MAEEKEDHWSSEAYQHSASFVPKLATKIVQWLDPQKDDVILDIGCGDGVLDIQMHEILAQGSGSIHGIDSSPAMIAAATQAAQAAGASKCTFEVLDALDLARTPHLQRGQYTKVFSNAALHWILGGAGAGQQAGFFAAAGAALAAGGRFAFEMGGLGNVAEVRAALIGAVARRLAAAEGVAHADAVRRVAARHDPWFFPDEAWARRALGGAWRVERVEREYRPTTADPGGVEGWIRLFGARFFDALPDPADREACLREVADVLEVVCRRPDGRFQLGYVRLRVLARKL
ncbi:S-adenosyl-L-methionine-dependent methyltransferase [Durotheca rogersii]|uniref:S-adenosyl-L-methionine-dependent methyltransferase n=1 Tax=Durotheca rogersii TaxID=419775 RepID=UPI00221E627E|nr:S-adenosyl-L-methionine-dependent methyltransferase [Durotheca rogersii]KAI5859545.1 S-adenosyl-L-methionine-dependent methyltransferase [Durotheca rogersii]